MPLMVVFLGPMGTRRDRDWLTPWLRLRVMTLAFQGRQRYLRVMTLLYVWQSTMHNRSDVRAIGDTQNAHRFGACDMRKEYEPMIHGSIE